MKKKIEYALLIVLALLGLSILMYPSICSKWNAYREQRLMTDYSGYVDNLEEDQRKQMLRDARAYNTHLESECFPDVFSMRDGTKDLEYEKLLNIDSDGVMGGVEIPKLDVNIPIYHYTKLYSLERGAGHLLGSSLPVGGKGSHAVLSAHRGLPGNKLFTDLNLIEKGDCFFINVLGEKLAYEVDSIKTVLPTQTRSLAIAEGKDYVTLVTCTPYGVNSHRLLVRGHRIPYSEKVYSAESDKLSFFDKYSFWIQTFCIILGLALAAFVIRYLNKRSKRKVKS